MLDPVLCLTIYTLASSLQHVVTQEVGSEYEICVSFCDTVKLCLIYRNREVVGVFAVNLGGDAEQELNFMGQSIVEAGVLHRMSLAQNQGDHLMPRDHNFLALGIN